MRYPHDLIVHVQQLRAQGKTYGEIQQEIGIKIPKSSLSWQTRNISLPKKYLDRIKEHNLHGLIKARRIALEMHKIKREQFYMSIKKRNDPIAQRICEKDIAKIALAMLCLGEASKYNPKAHRSFSLGSSDPRIIILFLKLLQQTFSFHPEKIRATVQCRADQNPENLKKYWQKITNIPNHLFYKPLVDPRTKGKPTKKNNYRGVLRIDYFDTAVQLELESLADLVYNEVHPAGP